MPKKTPKKFDGKAKAALREWPQASKKLWPRSRPTGCWLRGQPPDATPGPRLKVAGSEAFKTQPDGLWVFLARSKSVGRFADCVVIEACSSAQNFKDKQSRYGSNGPALVLQCSRAWLVESVKGTPRWELAGHRSAPRSGRPVEFPVRFLRVLFFLENGLYEKWRKNGVPEAHEFVAPYSSINSYTSPQMQGFLRRMTLKHHFYKGAGAKP